MNLDHEYTQLEIFPTEKLGDISDKTPSSKIFCYSNHKQNTWLYANTIEEVNLLASDIIADFSLCESTTQLKISRTNTGLQNNSASFFNIRPNCMLRFKLDSQKRQDNNHLPTHLENLQVKINEKPFTIQLHTPFKDKDHLKLCIVELETTLRVPKITSATSKLLFSSPIALIFCFFASDLPPVKFWLAVAASIACIFYLITFAEKKFTPFTIQKEKSKDSLLGEFKEKFAYTEAARRIPSLALWNKQPNPPVKLSDTSARQTKSQKNDPAQIKKIISKEVSKVLALEPAPLDSETTDAIIISDLRFFFKDSTEDLSKSLIGHLTKKPTVFFGVKREEETIEIPKSTCYVLSNLSTSIPLQFTKIRITYRRGSINSLEPLPDISEELFKSILCNRGGWIKARYTDMAKHVALSEQEALAKGKKRLEEDPTLVTASYLITRPIVWADMIGSILRNTNLEKHPIGREEKRYHMFPNSTGKVIHITRTNIQTYSEPFRAIEIATHLSLSGRLTLVHAVPKGKKQKFWKKPTQR